MAAPRKSRWRGALEGLADDGLVVGWCVDSEQPDARVVLEICINGETSGTVVADVARPDLAAEFKRAGAPADVCHGFVADLRVHAQQLPGAVTARVANSSHTLAGRVTHDVRPQAASAATSLVFGDGGLRLHGWCRRRGGRDKAAEVRAYVDGREVAKALADQLHPTLRSLGVESDGFIIDLPPEFADGRVHSVRVVNEEGLPLNGSPLTVCCYVGGARALLPAGQHPALEAVLEMYERYVPRSLGLDFYPAWREQFESHWTPARARHQKTAALVITNADAAGAEVTRASIAAQQGAKASVFTDVRQALDSRCDVIGFIRAGDELRPHAVAACLEAFSGDVAIAYTDSEFNGRPWFKPAWNPDYALASDYPLELMLVRRDFARAHVPAKPAAASPEALAWHWLASAPPAAIMHVPRAVYVWNSAPTAAERERRTAAAQAALQTMDPKSVLQPAIESTEPLFHPRRIVRPLSRAERNTPVTLIIPTRDRVELLARCIDSIRKHTRWPQLEIIVVDNDSAEPATHKYFRAVQRKGVRVLEHPGAFNFSAMNNRAVEIAKGAIVGLINNDIEALHDGWLDEIVGQLLRPGVGAVGAKLVWPNGMVQHGGVLLGVGNAAGHFGNRLADGDWGDHGRNQLAQQVSGATAACLFLRKKDYIAVGGMDETTFPVTFNDVDLCLKLRARGDAIVWTPFARLLHAESASRGKDEAPAQRARAQRELDALRRRWGRVLLHDPAYHPSLNLDPHSHAFGGLALPPRDRSPRTGALPV